MTPAFSYFIDCEGQSHKAASTNHNPFEEKGEPKRNQTEAFLLTSLTPYRRAKPVHSVGGKLRGQWRNQSVLAEFGRMCRKAVP